MITLLVCLCLHLTQQGARALTPAVGRGTLIQAQVIARHGARTPLTKTAAALLEGGAVLTPIGEKQQYDLGVWLREKYTASLNLTTYDSSKVHIQSSDFDRTVVSASSMALGLFPKSSRSHPDATVLLPNDVTPANVPVHTKDRFNDVDIRGYTLCPLIKERLHSLYDAAQFEELTLANIDLLTFLGKNKAFTNYRVEDGNEQIKLEELWNVYDAINVAMTECGNKVDVFESSPSCTALPDPTIKDYLSDVQWKRTKELAHQVELIKFGKVTTGSLIGANLLRTIVTRMGHVPSTTDDERRRQLAAAPAAAAAAPVDSDTLEKFIFFSGHYPTLLGLYSTLNIIELNPNTPVANEAIPEYASALIFELWYTDKSIYEVVAKFKHQSSMTSLILPCQTSENPCSLIEFFNSIDTITKKDDADTIENWCSTCKNNFSDVCTKAAIKNFAKVGGWSDLFMMLAMLMGMIMSMAVSLLCFMCKPNLAASLSKNPRRELSMGTRHGSRKAADMEILENEEDDEDMEELDDRI
jgi:hypothetical protein